MKRKVSLLNAGKVFLAVVLVNIAIQFLASVILLLADIENGTPEFSAFNYIFMLVLQMGNAVVLLLFFKKGFAVLEGVRKVKWWAYPLSAVIAGLCVYFFVWPANLFALWLQNIGYNFSDALTFDNPFAIIFGGITVCVIAPVMEELVFRGLMLPALTKKFNAFVSVLLCGLAFSLMHMNPEQTVYQFFIGCVCSYLTIRTRSVLPAITVHATSNIIAFVLSFFEQGEVSGELTTIILLTLLFTALGVLVVYFLGKVMEKAKVENKEENQAEQDEVEVESKKSVLVFYGVATLVCLFTWISVFITAITVVV